MEWLNFRHLFAYWSVCRYGGFQKAAKKIFVSQSAISDQVSQLEDYLDEKLLERSTRSLKITPRGKELLEYADEIFTKSSAINRVFKEKSASEFPQTLRVGLVGGVSRNYIYQVLAKHLGKEEVHKVQVIDGSYDELNSLLKSFELDLAFSVEEPRKKDRFHLEHRRVKESPLCLVGKAAILNNLKKAKPTQEPLDLYLFNHLNVENVVREHIEPKYGVEFKTPILTDDISLLRFLANSGSGLALMPQIGVKEDAAAGRLETLSIEGVPPISFFAMFLRSGFHKKMIDHFLS